MNPIAFSSEASPRLNATAPLIGRPTTDPKSRLVSTQRRNAQTLKVKVQASMQLAMDDTKRQLEIACGTDLSFPFLVRRSLDLYMTRFAKLTPEQVADEAATLKNRYR